MYQNCVFDLYGTLVDIHTDEKDKELWEKLALFYSYYGAFYTPAELRKSYESLVKEKENGYREFKIEEIFWELYSRKKVLVSIEHAKYTGQIFRLFSTKYVRLYDGTVKMLENLKKNGKRIYLLSNAQRIFTEYEIRALGIEDLFDAIYLSSDCGWQKPDSHFFSKLIHECQLKKEETVMIGNDGTCDVQGAKDVGLAAVYIRSAISPKEPFPKADHILKEVDMKKLEQILLG